MKKYLSFIFIALISLSSCKTDLSFDSIDIEQWKNDKLGCEEYRQSVAEKLYEQKAKLIGLSPSAISAVLGIPNENELYTRNQRFFIYYTGKGKQCKANSGKATPSITIRFDAIDRANEIFINR